MEFLETNFWWLLLIIMVIFVFAFKKITKNPDAITSKFVTKKIINGNPDDNLKNIREALVKAGFIKVGFDEGSKCFYASTKFSYWSFSENIELSLSPDLFSSTELKFKSICALPTQILDWGKNKRNYKRFEKELEKLIPVSDMNNW